MRSAIKPQAARWLWGYALPISITCDMRETQSTRTPGLLWARILLIRTAGEELQTVYYGHLGWLNTKGPLEKETHNMPRHVSFQFATCIHEVSVYWTPTTLYWFLGLEEWRRLVPSMGSQTSASSMKEMWSTGHRPFQLWGQVQGPEKKWLNLPGRSEKGSEKHWQFNGISKIFQGERGALSSTGSRLSIQRLEDMEEEPCPGASNMGKKERMLGLLS